MLRLAPCLGVQRLIGIPASEPRRSPFEGEVPIGVKHVKEQGSKNSTRPNTLMDRMFRMPRDAEEGVGFLPGGAQDGDEPRRPEAGRRMARAVPSCGRSGSHPSGEIFRLTHGSRMARVHIFGVESETSAQTRSWVFGRLRSGGEADGEGDRLRLRLRRPGDRGAAGLVRKPRVRRMGLKSLTAAYGVPTRAVGNALVATPQCPVICSFGCNFL